MFSWREAKTLDTVSVGPGGRPQVARSLSHPPALTHARPALSAVSVDVRLRTRSADTALWLSRTRYLGCGRSVPVGFIVLLNIRRPDAGSCHRPPRSCLQTPSPTASSAYLSHRLRRAAGPRVPCGAGCVSCGAGAPRSWPGRWRAAWRLGAVSYGAGCVLHVAVHGPAAMSTRSGRRDVARCLAASKLLSSAVCTVPHAPSTRRPGKYYVRTGLPCARLFAAAPATMFSQSTHFRGAAAVDSPALHLHDADTRDAFVVAVFPSARRLTSSTPPRASLGSSHRASHRAHPDSTCCLWGGGSQDRRGQRAA